jgi:hypothetical protein
MGLAETRTDNCLIKVPLSIFDEHVDQWLMLEKGIKSLSFYPVDRDYSLCVESGY